MNKEMRFGRWAQMSALVAVVLLAAALVNPPSAHAATGKVIASGFNLTVRSGPSTSSSVVRYLAPGTTVTFSCYENGTGVSGPYGYSTIWDRLDSGGYVADAWIYTGSNSAVVGKCGASGGGILPAGSGRVITTNGTPLNIRDSATNGRSIGTLAQGAIIKFNCYVLGDYVTGPYGRSNIWDRLESGGYVTDAWVYTGTNNPTVPRCAAAPSQPSPSPVPVMYNRSAAQRWAIANVYTPERSDLKGVDCTWFVSQALWVGGLPMDSAWNMSRSSTIAIRADELPRYLEAKGMAVLRPIQWSDNSARGAQIGDIIAYDWAGGKADGKYDHLAIVTKLDPYPSVSQHSSARLNRFWSWDPAKNNWIEYSMGRNTRATLVHIVK